MKAVDNITPAANALITKKKISLWNLEQVEFFQEVGYKHQLHLQLVLTVELLFNILSEGFCLGIDLHFHICTLQELDLEVQGR